MKKSALRMFSKWRIVFICVLSCLTACAKTPALEPGVLESASDFSASSSYGTESGARTESNAYDGAESVNPSYEAESDAYDGAESVDPPYETESAETDGYMEINTDAPPYVEEIPIYTGEAAELTVFACSSLRETLEEIADRWRASVPAVTLRFCFDGSGALLERLQEGAHCDLFLSAAPAMMDALDPSQIARYSDNLPQIDPNSRINLLENQMVLAVPLDNPAKIYNFEQLANRSEKDRPLIALAGAGEPEGRYARAVLNTFHVEGRTVRMALCASDSEAAARLSDGLADCGILFATERGRFAVVDTAGAWASGPITYTAAALADSRAPEAARAFLTYLSGSDAGSVFTLAGFTHLPSVPVPSDPESEAE